jgi:hypothetical protein
MFLTALAGNTGYCYQRAGADYQVTAGKTLHIAGIYFWNDAALAAASVPTVRYANDAALTNTPVAINAEPIKAICLAASRIFIPVFDTVPATKYVGIYNDSATATANMCGSLLIGYEV